MAADSSAPPATLPLKQSKAFRAILWGALIAGILDITAAIVTTILRGGRPARMLQSIASGVLGGGAYQGGVRTAALGLGLHFVIALGATAVYYAVSRKLTFFVRQAYNLAKQASPRRGEMFIDTMQLPPNSVRRSGT